MVSLKLTWMSQEVRVFLPFTLGLPGLSGWERAEAALESAATSTRKETKPDISCNILPNKFLKINMFCIRVTSCYSLVNNMENTIMFTIIFLDKNSRHIQVLF